MAYTTIDNPELYFQCKTYSGSSSDVTVTFDGSEDMQPDLVWLKKRSGSGDHLIYDSVRGTNKRLQPNATDAEVDRSSNNDELKSFNSDGWTLGTFNSNVTGAGSTNVSWNWKAGTSFTNDASATSVGTLDSSGSSSQTAGFSIVSYTSNGSSSQSVAHNLGAVPQVIISKNRDSSSSSYNYWTVYHHSNATANDKKLKLNTTDAVSSTNEWGDTDPTSSVYSLHTSGDGTTNVSSDKIVSYVFTGIQGYSKFGSYLANNSADGNFLYLGFKPAFFMVKASSGGSASARNWRIYDNKRSAINEMDDQLYPNTSGAEAVNDNEIDFLSNGVKLRSNDGGTNTSGETYIYMAFAEQPFVNSNGVPCNAR
jgi:hypothetical protein